MSNGQYVKFLVSFSYLVPVNQFDKLEFCGESPLTMRARCSAFRYFPNPLGIGTAKQFDKLEFVYRFSETHFFAQANNLSDISLKSTVPPFFKFKKVSTIIRSSEAATVSKSF